MCSGSMLCSQCWHHVAKTLQKIWLPLKAVQCEAYNYEFMHTVNGRNLAPVDKWFIPLFTGTWFYTSNRCSFGISEPSTVSPAAKFFGPKFTPSAFGPFQAHQRATAWACRSSPEKWIRFVSIQRIYSLFPGGNNPTLSCPASRRKCSPIWKKPGPWRHHTINLPFETPLFHPYHRRYDDSPCGWSPVRVRHGHESWMETIRNHKDAFLNKSFYQMFFFKIIPSLWDEFIPGSTSVAV